MAIALQQDREGYSWDEWVAFGLPRSGHTVCQGDCRCRIAPLMYVQFSTELEDTGLILSEEELGDRAERIIAMVEAWKAAGMEARDLNLVGLSAKQQEEYLEDALRGIGVEAA